MGTVTLGAEGLEVSQIGLGCMGMSEFYGPADHAESLATMERAVELGVTLFDTADSYGIGDNERLVGEFLAHGHRGRLTISTKFGPVRDPQTRQLVELRADPEYVRQACEASLERLGIDAIDLYYLHVPDPRVPIELTVGAMASLVKAGKVRYLGLSNVNADQIRAAHAVHPITAVQREWSLFTRDDEKTIVPACVELGIGYVAYSPLSRGLLSGAYPSVEQMPDTDVRRTVPRFIGENETHNAELLQTVRRVAVAHGATPAQVALAWLVHKGAEYGLTVVPIPGAKRSAMAEENIGAVDLRLTATEIAELDTLGARVAGSSQHPRPAAARSAAAS